MLRFPEENIRQWHTHFEFVEVFPSCQNLIVCSFFPVKIHTESCWHVLFLYSQPTSTFSILLSSSRTLWKLEQTTQCRCVSQRQQRQGRFFLLHWWKQTLYKMGLWCASTAAGVSALPSRAGQWQSYQKKGTGKSKVSVFFKVTIDFRETWM